MIVKCVPTDSNNYKPIIIQLDYCRIPGGKPLFEPTRSQFLDTYMSYSFNELYVMSEYVYMNTAICHWDGNSGAISIYSLMDINPQNDF